jgi:hypothetical protein
MGQQSIQNLRLEVCWKAASWNTKNMNVFFFLGGEVLAIGNGFRWLIPNKLAKSVTLLAYIRKVRGSNLTQCTPNIL